MKLITSRFSFLIAFLLLNQVQIFATSYKQIRVDFFSEQLEMEYDEAMLKKNKYCTSQTCLEKFYTKLEQTDYVVLLNNLQTYKEKLKLNDWFFYNLVEKSVAEIYSKQKGSYRTLVTWFLMTKAGYDTRLYTAQNRYSFLLVNTTDKVYEMPHVKVEGTFFLDLTSIYYSAKTKGLLLEMQKFQPGALNKQTFSLKINNYPNVKPKIIEKEFRFTHMQKEVKINVEIDTMSAHFLTNYPFIKTLNYIHTPFTETTKKSLIEAIRSHIKNLELEDQLSFLVSFTRKAFNYENDQINIRKDKPLTAEETLLSSASDFEDRVAILYQLLKEMTELNFVVIQYLHDDIVTVGIELPEVCGTPFVYEGQNYTICDPTMPRNTGKLGVYPIQFGNDYEILEEVKQVTALGMITSEE